MLHLAKSKTLVGKIKVGAVSYLNTKPLLYGLKSSDMIKKMELSLEFPSQLAHKLKIGEIDMALLPVAAIREIEGARIVGDYGIAADGEVASVAIFSAVPIEEVEEVLLDYQSRTSVILAQILLEKHWGKKVIFKQASDNFIYEIKGTTAAVIIGDRALEQLYSFEFVYDLSRAWKDFTGLPFVFAAWVTNKDLHEAFLQQFNEANAVGLAHLDEIVDAIAYPFYDLKTYFTYNIHYLLDEEKRKGLQRFLKMIP